MIVYEKEGSHLLSLKPNCNNV